MPLNTAPFIRLITPKNETFFVVGVNIEKITTSYGYRIRLHLVNGKHTDIGYALDRKELEPILERVAKHILDSPDETLDLRKYYKPNPRSVGGGYNEPSYVAADQLITS